MCAHVTRDGVSIRWHRDRSVTVLLPLQGHKTSYDTDRNSSPLVMVGEKEREMGRKTQRETDEGTERSERKERESHDCLCH